MIENNYLINQVELYFLSKRTQKGQIESLNEEALMADEKFADLKYRLKACTFDLQKAKYLNDTLTVEKLTKEQKALRENLEAVQKSLNVELEIYTPSCKICNDEGILDGNNCICFYKKLNELAYDFLGLPIPKLATFEQDSDVTENKTKIEKLKRYAQNFYNNSPSNIVLMGKRGTGKTFTAQAIADYLINNSYNAIFINAYQLNDVYLKMAYANARDKLVYEEILTKSDLLVIDDLGVEKILNGITAENLLMIITQRLANNKPFIVTTNLSPNEIGHKYDERILSRMCGKTSAIVNFIGNDQRFNKK